MKKLALALALLLPLGAAAQTGIFPANTVWGNATGSSAQPKATPWNSFIGTLPLTQYHFFIGNASNIATDTALGGDCTYTTSYGIICTKSNNVAFGAMAFLTSTAAGDLTGTWPTVTIAAGAVTSSKMATGAAASNVGTLGGDLTGTLPNPTIANNAVTNAKAAQAGANTMKGNWTGSTGNIADNAMPSCADTGGNHLNYVSGTGVTCGTTSTGNSIVLLNTLTANFSASLSDTTSFTSTYSLYQIQFINIKPSTDAVTCRIKVNVGGVQSTSYVAAIEAVQGGGASYVTQTTFIPCSFTNDTYGNVPGISGRVFLSDPSQTTAPKMFEGHFGYLRTGGGTSIQPANVSGLWNGSNAAVTGIQIDFSAGNIVSGTVKIYGVP